MERAKEYLPFLVFFFIIYLYGIHYVPLRGEEANRILTAYEMVYFSDYFNLTHLGDPYYLKPPLFMWVFASVSSLLGWSQESARIVSIFSVFLSALIVHLLYKRIFNSEKGGLLAALLLLSFGDLALFYGFLAEIDAFLMFLFLLSVYLVYLLLDKGKVLLSFLAGGVFTALLFLTKGIPAFYHLPVSFLVILHHFGRLKELISFRPFVGVFGMALPLGIWILNLKNPQAYLTALWEQTFMRTPVAQSGGLLLHLLTYPLLNLKQLLPHSVLAVFRIFKGNLPASREVLMLALLALINYLPYLISPGARGRYILPIFPFLALLLGRLFENSSFLFEEGKPAKTVYGIALFLFAASVGLFIWNYPFFENYGILPFLLVGGFTFLTLLWYRKKLNLLVSVLLLVGVLKVGYVNYLAPFYEKRHPERKVALLFASRLPQGVKIRYLPEKVNMSLCAYLDVYSKGIVLRREGEFFITTEGKLPEGNFRILAESRGWVLGRFGN